MSTANMIENTDLLTREEFRMLEPLIHKKQKKLLQNGRTEEANALMVIWRKLTQQWNTLQISTSADPKEELQSEPEVGSVPSPAEPVLMEVSITADAKILCKLVVQADADIEREDVWKALQGLQYRLDGDSFKPARPTGVLGAWDNFSVSSQVLTPEFIEDYKDVLPDFTIARSTSEGTGEPMYVLQDLRGSATDAVLAEGDDWWYRDAAGEEVFLTVQDTGLIHTLLQSEIGIHRSRKRLEDVAHHQAVMEKIGTRGGRILPQLRRLSDDDQAIPAGTGGGR